MSFNEVMQYFVELVKFMFWNAFMVHFHDLIDQMYVAYTAIVKYKLCYLVLSMLGLDNVFCSALQQLRTRGLNKKKLFTALSQVDIFKTRFLIQLIDKKWFRFLIAKIQPISKRLHCISKLLYQFANMNYYAASVTCYQSILRLAILHPRHYSIYLACTFRFLPSFL